MSTAQRYDALLEELYQRHTQKMGGEVLQRLEALRALFHLPSEKIPCIHIAGSNGKGSVATKVAQALRHTGRRVGLYTSPHVRSFCERIAVNGVSITEEEVCEGLEFLLSRCKEEKIEASFFELTTFLAFRHFEKQQVDLAVLETGLGGRLDATNSISHVLLSVVTSISMEHSAILGDTLEKIAGEKAGIFKAKTPVVLGPCARQEVLFTRAHELQCPLTLVEGDFVDFDQENSAIARHVLEILQVPAEAIEEGIRAKALCRFQVFTAENHPFLQEESRPRALLFDAAHNADGLRHLMDALDVHYSGQKKRFLVGLSQSHDLAASLLVLKDANAPVHSVRVPFKGISVEEMRRCCAELKVAFVSYDEDIPAAWNAVTAAVQEDEILVVCGSFYHLDAVLRLLEEHTKKERVS